MLSNEPLSMMRERFVSIHVCKARFDDEIEFIVTTINIITSMYVASGTDTGHKISWPKLIALTRS